MMTHTQFQEIDQILARHAQRFDFVLVPGLNDSPPGHWQSSLQASHRDAVRVVKTSWTT